MVSLSIIIATCGRPERLRVTIEHVGRALRAWGGEGEVVVVDNHPDHGAEEVVRGQKAEDRFQVSGFSSPPLIRYLRSTPFNKAAALNAGIRAARAEWLAFTDDDCLPAEDWLVRLTAFAASSGLRVIGGQVRVGEQEFDLPRWLKPGRSGRVPWGPAFVVYAPMSQSGVVANGVRLPLGSNIFVRADVFREHGGYDEDLWRRCGKAALGSEDGEFAIRLQQRGEKIGFCAEALVIHPVLRERVDLRSFLRYAYNTGYRDSVIFAEDTSPRWWSPYLPARAARTALRGICRLLARDHAAAVCEGLDCARAIGQMAALFNRCPDSRHDLRR